jgi:uncharacterized membrane protein
MGDVRARRTERLFRIALLVKGVDGAAELVAAVALLLVPTATVHRLVADIVSRDLLGPPDGFLARHLVAGTEEFASGNRSHWCGRCCGGGAPPIRWRQSCSVCSWSTS